MAFSVALLNDSNNNAILLQIYTEIFYTKITMIVKCTHFNSFTFFNR